MAISTTPHFQIAWRAFKAHWRVFVISMLVLFASWVILELSVVALHRFGVVLNVLLHLAFLVLASGLMVGIHSIAMEVVDGRMPHLRLLTGSLARGPRYLLAFCLYFISVVVGLLLLVVPGVYVAVRYALFGQVLATKQTSTLGALRDAGSLSRGQWWAMCRVVVAALALNLGGAALLGLGLLISFPISLLVASSLFRTLQHTPVAFDHAQPNHPLQPTSGVRCSMDSPEICARRG